MPETSALYTDGLLSQVATKYRNPGYVGRRFLPLIPSNTKFGKYPVFGFERFAIPRTLRAPRTQPARVDWTLTRGSYECWEHALEQALDDQERAQQPDVDAETTTVETVTDMLEVAGEKRIADLLTSTAVITQYHTLAGTEQWNHTDWDSDPIGNVRLGHQVIAAATGLRANKILIPRLILDTLETHPQILDRLSVTGTIGNARVVTPQILAVLFQVDEVVIADTLYNSAIEGAAVDIDPIWGDNVILAHVIEGAGDKPRVGSTVYWQQMGGTKIVNRYRDNPIKSDVFQVAEHVDELIMCAAAAYLIRDVLA